MAKGFLQLLVITLGSKFLAANLPRSYNLFLIMATFHILNFGCRASQADGAALKQQLLQSGLQEASGVEDSTVAILNTCTVTASADAEVRQFVRRIHRRNPQCKILVTGCYAQRAPQEIANLEGVAWVVGNSHKHLVSAILAGSGEQIIGSSGHRAIGSLESDHRLVGSADEKPEIDRVGDASHREINAPLVQINPDGGNNNHKQISGEPALADLQSLNAPMTQSPNDAMTQWPNGPMVKWPDDPIRVASHQSLILVGEITEEFHFAPVFADDRTRPTLKIQDGCDARCSFCIIPTVRGQSRSLAPRTVLDQVKQLVDSGYREIVLSGINLGGYGRDLDRSINFLGIVERILRETSIARIRISSIELMDVSPALVRLVATEPRMAQHFHIPLQSGCDRILRLMNRRYWTRHYAERMFDIHEQIPNAALGADVMVGFPGETDQDHAESLGFIESIPFTYLHIFPYSARPGTPASTASGQVNGRIAHERSQEIRAVIDSKREAFLGKQIGKIVPAMTLDEIKEGARIALTTNYLKVTLPGGEVPPNRLINAAIERVTDGQLFGYAEEAPAVLAGLPD